MKKILITLLLITVSLFSQEKMMDSIFKNVLIKNIDDSMNVALKFSDDLNAKKDATVLKKDFHELVRTWKKVETFYLAGSMNDEAIDIPRYIDVFHNLKENLHEQMQRVIVSKESVEVEMYKNSFKTINALEYVLFTGEISQRRIDISKIIINNILNQLDSVKEVYLSSNERFLNDFKWTNDEIINMLIDSSFKLRDWRVGDPAGLSRKYKGNPDNKRAEYFLSKNSKTAIKAILDTHSQIMNSKEYDFGDMLKKEGFDKEVNLINAEIKNSYENLKYLQDGNFENKDVKKLYASLDALHKAYYISLVNAVGITAKILDADGD